LSEPVKVAPAQAGLAPLVLTLIELIRQLMEAQVIRQMDQELLTEAQVNAAATSLIAMENQVLRLCETFGIDPQDLNLDLGEVGKLLPDRGAYYPGQPSPQASILELLDRLLTTGVVLQGEVDLGVAGLDLVHARLYLMLSTHTSLRTPPHATP